MDAYLGYLEDGKKDERQVEIQRNINNIIEEESNKSNTIDNDDSKLPLINLQRVPDKT